MENQNDRIFVFYVWFNQKFLGYIQASTDIYNSSTYSEIRKELNFIETIVMDDNNYDLLSLAGKLGVINGSLTQLTEEEVERYQQKYINNKDNLFWQKKNMHWELLR